MTRFTESGLHTLCWYLEIKILNLYFGSYTMSFKVSHPCYRLVFVLESDGKSFFADSEKEVPCLEGRWYLLPPFCEVTHVVNNSMKHLSIHFSASVEGALLLTPAENTFYFADENDVCGTVKRELAENSELSQALLFYGLCHRALAHVITPEDSRRILEFLKVPGYAGLLQFLNAHATAAVTLEKMAEISHLSTNAFVKRFTRDAGVTPGRFLARILTARAASLLTEKRKSVKETAALLEFSTPFAFSRFFHRQTGTAPREFQKKLS
ncbi:MAG: helix-turn-helix transcriptional regulator [Lentisphaeria bacterium]|nr:helix-turn-helix transcriptional regulator [Lentisphaeria bacterium]